MRIYEFAELLPSVFLAKTMTIPIKNLDEFPEVIYRWIGEG